MKVLLIEDNAADARLVRELLREDPRNPVTLTHCELLEKARGILQHEGFNAILLDLSLPDSQGLTTFTEAQAEARNSPIVVLTGSHDEDLAIRAVREGAQDYLVKGQVDGPMLSQSLRYAVERRRVETELRASEARYRGLIEGSIQGILIHVDGVVRLVNPALSRLLGFEHSEEFVGQNIWSFVAPEDRETVAENARSRLSGELSPARYEFRAVRCDGSIVWLDCFASAIDWGNERGLLATMVDITERKRAEAALRASEEQFRQAQKMEAVGRLAGGVAHDFNNLLSVILGWTGMALEELPAGHEVRTHLDEVVKAGQAAAGLTRQLLAFSRQQVLESTVFNANDLVVSMDKMFRRLIGEHIEFQTKTDPELGTVKMDRGQLEQVLMNLVVNARDAMPDGGTLAIETANVSVSADYPLEHIGVAPGQYVTLAVCDSGVGMSDEVKTRLFEPFFTTKEAGKGTGLGLATSYGIAKQAGGYIGVASVPGAGTTMTVYVPRRNELAVQAPPQLTRAPGTRAQETILLVEDEPAVRRVTSRMLEGHGYRVLLASGGEEALRLIENAREPLHLLLTDVVLAGGMSGVGLAERVRDLSPELKVLFVSGYTSDVDILHGLLERGISHVQKPFTATTLVEKVRQVLDASGEPG